MSENTNQPMTAEDVKEMLWSMYGGENKPTTDGGYDQGVVPVEREYSGRGSAVYSGGSAGRLVDTFPDDNPECFSSEVTV